MTELFPPLEYSEWSDTLATVHRFSQVVGKLRLAHSPRRNHWWNVPFHLTGRGITTRPMGLDPTFALEFDYLAHQLRIDTTDGRSAAFGLVGHSVATFHAELVQMLAAVGVNPATIADAHPFDLPDAERRFADDTEHAAYDAATAGRYWQILAQVNVVLEEFAGRFSGKTSPVHHFWHTFDIAVTRFADVVIDQPATADPVTREAYSREVVSSGFWFGDPSFPEAAFYSYTAPEPEGLTGHPLAGGAEWTAAGSGSLALLPYDTVRAAKDPRATLLAFLESAYEAGTAAAGWPAGELRSSWCPPGVGSR